MKAHSGHVMRSGGARQLSQKHSKSDWAGQQRLYSKNTCERWGDVHLCTDENVWLWSICGLDTREPSRGAGWKRLLLFLALFPCALNTRMWFRDGFLNWASLAHKDLLWCWRRTVKFVHRIDIESRGDILNWEITTEEKINKKRDTRYKNKRRNSAVVGIYNCLIV